MHTSLNAISLKKEYLVKKQELCYCYLDTNKIQHLLSHDFKDDWFQDPLLYQELFDDEFIFKYFSKKDNNKFSFSPKKRLLLNIPKNGGTLRYSLETNFYDRMAYTALGTPLVENFDSLISRRVFNQRFNQYRSNRDSKKYLFLSAIEQWKKFDSFSRIGIENKTVLMTDLQNFFENIRIDLLKEILIECVKSINFDVAKQKEMESCINSLVTCMTYWSYNGNNGLPQNRDISSFIANLYLLPVDRFLENNHYDFYRYMDDIRIICDDKYEARKALKQLIVELRKLGLSVNGAKTKIISPNTAEHSELLMPKNFKFEQIDSMLNSKKKVHVFFAFHRIRDDLLELIKSNNFQSRDFRFYIGRICKVARCKDISLPRDFFQEITINLIPLLDEYPDVMDQFYSYLSSVPLDSKSLMILQDFLLNKSKAIYSWQNYLLWKLLALRLFKSSTLIEKAFDILNKNESQGEIAGALLYIGACGNQSDRVNLTLYAHQLEDFFTQRHLLIAIQEVEYKIVKNNVAPYINSESQGLYKKMRHRCVHKGPLYIVPPEPVEYKELIREVSFYV